MALPASMTTAATSMNTFNDRNNLSKEGSSKVAGGIHDGEKNLKSVEGVGSGGRDDDGDDKETNAEEGGEGSVEERREIDDDEVLRILSLLEGEEGENDEEGEDMIMMDEEEEEEEEDDGKPVDPSKQLQQRLKGVYSRRKNTRRGSLIGDVVFDVVDNKGRVRDIRKSQLSDPPTAPKTSLFSSPSTEQNNKSNTDTSYQKSVYQSGSNKKTGGTVAEALEALKNPFPFPPKLRDSYNNRGTGIPGVQGMPGGSIVSTNSRLRALARRPVGGSYEGEEVDRALRYRAVLCSAVLCCPILSLLIFLFFSIITSSSSDITMPRLFIPTILPLRHHPPSLPHLRRVTQLCPLNPSQLSALQSAVLQSVSLIQGPPGTGKTR